MKTAREMMRFLVGISEDVCLMNLEQDTQEERVEFIELYTGFRPECDIPNGEYIVVYSVGNIEPYIVEDLKESFDYIMTRDDDEMRCHLVRIEEP